MDKLATIVASSRGFPVPLGRWATLLLVSVVAMFLLGVTWYTRSDTLVGSYRNDYLNTPPTPAALDAQSEGKNILYDHSRAPTAAVATKSGNYTRDHCLRLPGADRVLVILKTGATAVYDRLPIHFESTLKCIPNYIIISDLEQTIGDTHIHDALKLVSQETRQNHDDFQIYHSIQYYHTTGQDASKLNADAAWRLDKWKFLPMIHKAWEVSQNTYNNTIDWFVMMEADTSLSWLNLIQYLAPLDPQKPQYIGSPAMLVSDQSTFAHGGSGVIMSRTAIEKVENRRKTFTEGQEGTEKMSMVAYDKHWEKHTEEVCCGDAVLAHAFTDVKVPVTNARPMIQGDTPLTLPFEPPPKPNEHNVVVQNAESDLWCKTPITFHHVNTQQVLDLYQFEVSWADKYGWNTSYYYRDIFERFILPYIVGGQSKEDWDNQSDWIKIEWDDTSGSPDNNNTYNSVTVAGPQDQLVTANQTEREDFDAVTAASASDPGACQSACERRGAPFTSWVGEECVQWKWSQRKCYLGNKIRLGEVLSEKVIKEKHSPAWTSGWMGRRVQKYVMGQKPCGDGLGQQQRYRKPGMPLGGLPKVELKQKQAGKGA